MVKTKPKNGKQRFAKIYRQFTRVKFNKYKLQYPRIRQSQIIAKIIKQWEAMDQNAKQNLAQQYIQKSGKSFLEDPSSSQKKQSKQKKSKHISPPVSLAAQQAKRLSSSGDAKQKTKGKKISPKVRVFQQKQKQPSPAQRYFQLKSSQNSKSPGKKSTPQKKSTSSSQLAIEKAKKISKSAKRKQHKNQQFISFYKYYYDRLRVQHTRWTNPQITTIIKLLWKKRNLVGAKKQKGIPTKRLTGRKLYSITKQSQGFLREQIRQLWRALPYQSKKYWQIKGLGKPHHSKKDSGRYIRKVLNLGCQSNQQPITQSHKTSSSFNWLNQPIHSIL